MSLMIINCNNEEVLSISSFVNPASNKSKLYTFLSDVNYNENYFIQSDEAKLSLKDIICLKINVSYVGIFTSYFKKETFNLSFLSNIKSLKAIDSSTYEKALEKINKLLTILFEVGFILSLFQPYKNGYRIIEMLFQLFESNKKYLLYIKETCLDKSLFDNSINAILVNNKLKWWLTIISGLVIGCNIAFGVLKVYQNNIGFAIFMFITVLASFVALYISHNDIVGKKRCYK